MTSAVSRHGRSNYTEETRVEAKITLLPGDGVGPEIGVEAIRVLKRVEEVYGHHFRYAEALIGGAAIDATGVPLPDETLQLCKESDAVLLISVGGPKWDNLDPALRPERGLLGLRKVLDLYANLRPVKLYPSLLHASPLRPEVIADVDLVVVRELTGGIYFGEPRGRETVDGVERAINTMVYTEPEIERIVRVAFRLARQRRNKVTSVDKANVLVVSQLWREVAERVAQEYPDVEFENLLVDACAMYLVKNPDYFDVIVTGNMFGDIITDEASMLAGSMGMLPSASLSGGRVGLYEPIHGSAPKHTGKDRVNPIAGILSVAMLLRHSLDLEAEAQSVEGAVSETLGAGYRTYDIAGGDVTVVGTREMGERIAERIA